MKADRLKKIEVIYHSALDVSADERSAYLAEICKDDEELYLEVKSLINFAEVDSSLIDVPPMDVAAEFFSGQKSSEMSGKKIDHYKIVSKIGEGGMGEVYLAKDLQLERNVAIKFIKTEFAQDPYQLQRFLQEAKTASSLNHPNIITVYEIGEANEANYISTEFIEGKTLRSAMNKGDLTFEEMLSICAQVATALQAAHTAGIFHRDIKPENIMLREDKLVKVLDFGLAKLIEKRPVKPEIKIEFKSNNSPLPITNSFATSPGLVMGTAAYMSPEQARVDRVDARSDIWSLGVVLYEMFAGEKPFQGKTSADVIDSILKNKTVFLADNIPHEVGKIIRKALQNDANDRYQTAKELLEALNDCRIKFSFGGVSNQISATELNTFETSQNKKRNSSPVKNRVITNNYSDNGRNIRSSAEHIVDKIKNNKTFLFGIMASLVLAFSVMSYYMLTSGKQEIKSVAVLPFINESSDKNLNYLSEGISERLIDSLSQLSQLKVIARSSSFQYKNKEVDLQKIAAELNVQAILTGRFTLNGDDLSISLELINVDDKTLVWSDSFDRKVGDIQLIEEEVARKVSQELRLKLNSSEEQQIVKPLTNNYAAYQLFLNGIYHRRKGGIENVKKALEFQENALKIDPDFALAYTEKAVIYSYLIENGVIDPQTHNSKARQFAEKALALDDSLAEAHLALAKIKNNELDWKGAETDFLRAIEISPNLARAHGTYAEFLSRLGRNEEALKEIRLAQELDPLRVMLKSTEGSILYFAGRFDEALEKLKSSEKLDSENTFTHAFLGITYTAKGQFPEALEQWQLNIKIDGKATPTALIYLGQIYSRSGKRDKAFEILKELEKTSEYVSPVELAILYTTLGEEEKAFESLEKAYKVKDLQLQFLKVDAAFDDLRDDPRFQDLLRRIGLA